MTFSTDNIHMTPGVKWWLLKKQKQEEKKRTTKCPKADFEGKRMKNQKIMLRWHKWKVKMCV